MLLKVIFGLVSMALMVIFVAPVVIKIKSVALIAVILIVLSVSGLLLARLRARNGIK